MYEEKEDKAPYILNPGTWRCWVSSFMLCCFTPKETAPKDTRLGGSWASLDTVQKGKRNQPNPSSIPQSVTWLRYENVQLIQMNGPVHTGRHRTMRCCKWRTLPYAAVALTLVINLLLYDQSPYSGSQSFVFINPFQSFFIKTFHFVYVLWHTRFPW
jgi:hypothetical protein